MKISTVLHAFLFISLSSLFAISTSRAQQWDGNRMKIELSINNGANTTVSSLTSLSISYNNPSATTTKDSVDNLVIEDYNPCYIVITFDQLDLPLLRLFRQKNTTLNGQITVTDSYGKRPTRKIELKSVVMDGMNDNFINDSETSFMNLSCKELIVDGIILKN
ncbi:MAG: hypothetical protein LBE37_04980 [Sphingobacterium sp.]|jgi:hypothetical protein|nr:hypothetical protein [Sphingobacterium sp.]